MLKLHNTLTNKKEEFWSIETGKVKMYTCGPTVYDYAHIGNFTAYIFADTLRRYLEYSGFEVRHITNITDVGHLTADDVNQADSGEDKMLKAALREKKTPEEIANFYTESYFDDIKKLNIKKSQYYPRATFHIPQMIKITETLIQKGLAYEKNGNVFFNVDKFPNYGKLSNKKVEELKDGARLEEHPDKRHPYDFALWLKAPKEHILKWESPWGIGYPGWHIECSAMSMEYLGETLDIHTGGEDHFFPHHENEIAQSEGATGKPFSHFWFHNRFLLVDGKKMSKSKENFYILKDVTDRGYDPMVFRLLIISSHYRSNVNFTWETMDQAQTNLEKITRFVKKLQEMVDDSNKKEIRPVIRTYVSTYEKEFKSAMDDDLNTPIALSVLFKLISKVNKDVADGKFNKEKATEVLNFWKEINKILGLRIKSNKKMLPENVEEMLASREAARKENDFEKADRLRDKIDELGFTVEDTSEGQKARRK
ncbi:MAG: cysteine--tRNA ligase [Patescibacteria group bacterium]|nr:cysteine--tRNA ligase [Patescibacteria group bacterium]